MRKAKDPQTNRSGSLRFDVVPFDGVVTPENEREARRRARRCLCRRRRKTQQAENEREARRRARPRRWAGTAAVRPGGPWAARSGASSAGVGGGAACRGAGSGGSPGSVSGALSANRRRGLEQPPRTFAP